MSRRPIVNILEGSDGQAWADWHRGTASIMRSTIAPNPLPVELWGYAPEDAAQLVRLVVDECVDADIALREIRVDPVIVHELTGSKSECGVVHRDVPISADTDCRGRVDIFGVS